MQTFERECIDTHCVGAVWPDFLGRVELGESFLVETVGCGPNGPISIEGIKAGDDIAIHVEKIHIEKPHSANGLDLEFRDRYFYWPQHFRVKATPAVGNVAVLPEPTEEFLEISEWIDPVAKTTKNPRGWRRLVRDLRGKNCHQDCNAITEGAIVHMKARVDGAGVCLDNVHGFLSQGELGTGSVSVSATVQVRIERSTGWLVDWPVIETEREILVFCSCNSGFHRRPRRKYVDVVKEARRAMCDVVVAKVGCTREEAEAFCYVAMDIRNCAIYGLGGYMPPAWYIDPEDGDIALSAAIAKDGFVKSV